MITQLEKKKKVRAKLETTQLVAEPGLEPQPPARVKRSSHCKSFPRGLRSPAAEECALQKDLRMKSKACLGTSPSGEHICMAHISKVSKQHPDDRSLPGGIPPLTHLSDGRNKLRDQPL